MRHAQEKLPWSFMHFCWQPWLAVLHSLRSKKSKNLRTKSSTKNVFLKQWLNVKLQNANIWQLKFSIFLLNYKFNNKLSLENLKYFSWTFLWRIHNKCTCIGVLVVICEHSVLNLCSYKVNNGNALKCPWTSFPNKFQRKSCLINFSFFLLLKKISRKIRKYISAIIKQFKKNAIQKFFSFIWSKKFLSQKK